MPDFLRSRTTRVLTVLIGISLFYLMGVVVRQHSGICILIQNETSGTVQELSVRVDENGERHRLADLARGRHERVFVKTPKESSVILEFTEPGRALHATTVFDHAGPGDCGFSKVRIMPQRRTESYETRQTVSWKGWIDFL